VPGNVDSPISVISSSDGTTFVTTLLEGVTLEEVFSGELRYLDLHAANSKGSPTLACADLAGWD
jgi:hypothetical protein